MDAVRKDLIAEACAPFDKPGLRQTLENVKRETEQALDIYTPDEVIGQGFDEAAKAKAAGLVQAFTEYLTNHRDEITALQVIYSLPRRNLAVGKAEAGRPGKLQLTEPMLKELEQKLREQHATWTEDRLWEAHAVSLPGKVHGRSQAGRFADLVSLVRFSLEQQPVLKPFAESVAERFKQWILQKQTEGTKFTPDQRAWLELIRDQIATTVTVEPEDFEFAPFSQRGGLGRAHQLFGDQLTKLLDELNHTLAA